MKKNVVICVLALVIAIGFAGVASAISLFADKKGNETFITDYSGQKLYDASGMSEEQISELNELVEAGRQNCGRFIYREKVILGEADATEARPTLEEVMALISGKTAYEEIEKEIGRIRAYPDFAGGSGVSLTEYWLNDDGSEKIVLIAEQGSISYVKDGGESKKLF